METRRHPDDKQAIQAATGRSVLWEGELLLDPDFFATLDGFTADIRVKRARAHNELSRYRYDVVLRPGAPRPTTEQVVRWTGPDFTLTDNLRVTGIPNARLTGDLTALLRHRRHQPPGRRRGRRPRGPARPRRGPGLRRSPSPGTARPTTAPRRGLHPPGARRRRGERRGDRPGSRRDLRHPHRRLPLGRRVPARQPARPLPGRARADAGPAGARRRVPARLHGPGRLHPARQAPRHHQRQDRRRRAPRPRLRRPQLRPRPARSPRGAPLRAVRRGARRPGRHDRRRLLRPGRRQHHRHPGARRGPRRRAAADLPGRLPPPHVVAELVGVVADRPRRRPPRPWRSPTAPTPPASTSRKLLPLSPSRRASTSTRSPTTTTPTWSSRSSSSTGRRPRQARAARRSNWSRGTRRCGPASGRGPAAVPCRSSSRRSGCRGGRPRTTSPPRSAPARSTWPHAPLLRCALIDGRKLVLTFHHIVADGWSLPVLHRELLALYAGEALRAGHPVPGVPAQPRRARPRERA